MKCLICGKETEPTIRNKNVYKKFCSKLCQNKNQSKIGTKTFTKLWKNKTFRDDQKKKLIDRNKNNWKNSEYREKMINVVRQNGYATAHSDKWKPRYGTLVHYKGYRMRSMFECNFAKFLDAINVKWKYEYKTFELSDGSLYTPDFYLPHKKIWIELKPHRNIQKKHILAKETLNLIIIDERFKLFDLLEKELV